MRIKVVATFYDAIEPQDWAEEFREANQLEGDQAIEEEELAEFALDQFKESLVDGEANFDEMGCVDVSVTPR